MGFSDQSFRRGTVHARQRNLQRYLQTEAPLRPGTDTNGRGDRCVRRDLRAALRRHEFRRRKEASGVTGGKKLLWVSAGPTGAAEFFRGAEFDSNPLLLADRLIGRIRGMISGLLGGGKAQQKCTAAQFGGFTRGPTLAGEAGEQEALLVRVSN